jgi:hypothetical protein
MARCEFAACFALISIDSLTGQAEHRTALSISRTPNFGASFSRKMHPIKGMTPWELPLQLSASGTTCKPAY